jgi:hypothetical protein
MLFNNSTPRLLMIQRDDDRYFHTESSNKMDYIEEYMGRTK